MALELIACLCRVRPEVKFCSELDSLNFQDRRKLSSRWSVSWLYEKNPVTWHITWSRSFKLRKWFISLPRFFFFSVFFFFGVWYRCLGFGTVVTVVVKGYRTVHELVNNFQVWRSNNYITGTHERHERRNALISDWLPFAPKNWPYWVPKKHW